MAVPGVFEAVPAVPLAGGGVVRGWRR